MSPHGQRGIEAEAIPLLDLAEQNGPLLSDLRNAIEGVLQSNRFILGPEVQAFEQEIAKYLGCAHAVGVSSGTDALLVALMALQVGPGDEVITTPFTFFATAGCVSRLGAKPVFVDIDPETYNLDVARLEQAITPRTKALLPVHLFGQTCPLKELLEVADKHGLAVVEDAAQAIGARTDLGMAGGVGTLGCISFFPSKNLGCMGDGGLVATQDAELAARVRTLRGHGAKPKYFHALIGGNFRLDALQAAALRVKLPHLDGWMQARRSNARIYDALIRQAGLDADLLSPPARVADGHVYNQYVIRSSRRDALRDHLRERQIGTEIYYPAPLHLQACFRALGYQPGDLPQAERAAREVLALPVFPGLGQVRIERVVATMVDFLRPK